MAIIFVGMYAEPETAILKLNSRKVCRYLNVIDFLGVARGNFKAGTRNYF